MSLLTTSSQTVGPYVRIGFQHFLVEELAPPGVTGERITLTGHVTDADGEPVNDGVIEIWQANAHGKYAHPEDAQDKPVDALFRGFGRSLTDDKGGFRFATIKPGRAAGPRGILQAPHIAVTVFMRGLLKHLATRIYFPDEAAANAEAVRILAKLNGGDEGRAFYQVYAWLRNLHRQGYHAKGHFDACTEISMLATSLPVLMKFARDHALDPLTLGMVWTFGAGPKLFIYESAVLVVGYSYGYFDNKDMLKVGAILSVVTAVILLLLVPLYWPLIGIGG